MEFLAGFATAMLAYRVLRSFFSEEDNNNTAEYYRGSVANKIRLARAILDELPARQAIKNQGVEKWRTDLIAAADEGDVALQSSTADSRTLEKALRNLEALTEDADMYIDYSFKSEVIEVINSAAAAGTGNPETPLFVVLMPPDICRPNDRSEICHPLENIPENQNPMAPVRTPSVKKFCPSSKISKTRTGKISKKCRGLGLKQNSHKGLIYNGEQCIDDCTERKGKCPEGELDHEQTGYGEASMPTLS